MEPYLRYLPIVLTVAIVAARVRELRSNRPTVPGVRKDALSFILFVLCGVAVIVGCIAEYVWHGMRLHWLLVLAGVTIVAASFAIRGRARAALGRFWSVHVEMREGHELVQSGPFRFMRHPVYFSLILELLGLATLLQAWVTLAAVMLIFIPTMLRRLRLEEAALLGQFGREYAHYQRTTPLLIPWWRRAEK